MLISGILDKIFRLSKISGKIVTSPVFKNIIGHKSFICQPIFKLFSAHFTTNLGHEIILPRANKIKILPENLFSEVKFNTTKI